MLVESYPSMNIKEVIAQVLDLTVDELPNNAAMGNIPGWDSIGHLNILSAVAEHCGVEVPFGEITELIDLPSIEKYFLAQART